jgi:hypothetical protein
MSITFEVGTCRVENGHQYINMEETEYGINLANGNAYLLLDALGLKVDSVGELSTDELRAVWVVASRKWDDLRRITHRNDQDNYLMGRINDFMLLAQFAVGQGKGVAWA